MKPVKANTLVLMRDNNEPNLLSTFPLQECQGDCDSGKLQQPVVSCLTQQELIHSLTHLFLLFRSDSDCDEGLACFQRNKKMKIPGCSGRGTKGLDYCSRPTADEKRISGTPSYALGKCQDGKDMKFETVC